jgi:hypothetical protein
MLEVLEWRPEAREAIVLAGLGPRAQWLRNVLAGGPADVRIGGRDWPAVAHVLDPVEAAATLASYESRNHWVRPVVQRVLSRLSAVDYDGSDAARLAVVEALPLVAFTPARPAGGA